MGRRSHKIKTKSHKRRRSHRRHTCKRGGGWRETLAAQQQRLKESKFGQAVGKQVKKGQLLTAQAKQDLKATPFGQALAAQGKKVKEGTQKLGEKAHVGLLTAQIRGKEFIEKHKGKQKVDVVDVVERVIKLDVTADIVDKVCGV